MSVNTNSPEPVDMNFAVTYGSKICVVTAGVRQKDKETRLDLVKRNADILKSVIPQLLKYSPDTIILLASNPVDLLTYVAWKISGMPKHRIIGSGTNLDSARFRFLLSRRLQVAPSSCHGYIIGEHGDSMVPVWSGVNVSGVRLRDLNPNIGTESDPEHWQDVFKEVVESGYHVRTLKGCTSWAIGLSIADICKSIISNTNSVHPVSTYVTGEHCIQDEIFLSLPCILGYNGVTNIVRLQLTDTELNLLRKSADVVAKSLKELL